MNDKALKTLEYTKIRERLTAQALSPMGKAVSYTHLAEIGTENEIRYRNAVGNGFLFRYRKLFQTFGILSLIHIL